MTGYHAPRPPPDVHHRRSASEWTHRQTLAQTGCSRTDWTLFWLLQGSAAARKLTPRTDLRRTSFFMFPKQWLVSKNTAFPSLNMTQTLSRSVPLGKHCNAINKHKEYFRSKTAEDRAMVGFILSLPERQMKGQRVRIMWPTKGTEVRF